MYPKILPLICIILAFLFRIQASFSSPRASADLICHTSHASECYPRTFQPTTYFQRIHDDQDLPAGLHIRVNLKTGKKEAKLNEGEGESGEVSKGVVVVEPLESKSEEEEPLFRLHDQQVLQDADQGSIRPPPSVAGEGVSFYSSQEVLKNASDSSDPNILLQALEILEDLSHDIYWGFALAKDASTVQKLVGLLSRNSSDTRVKAEAALVFGTAIQNNPAALKAALSHCYNDELPTGPMEAVITALLHEQLPHLLSRFIYLLSALSQDQTQLINFMNIDGMEILLNVFDAENAGQDGKDRLRLKIANFVLDHFLQPDFANAVFENETGKDSIVDREVESKLENEDSWVIASAPNEAHVSRKDLEPKRKNAVQILKPWCAAFSTSTTKWMEKKSDHDIATTMKDIGELQIALQRRLADLGDSCDSERKQ